jgi:putative acetyltransferase
MSGPALIRPERTEDFPAIRTLVAAAFDSAAEADLVEAIRASERYIAELALVAELAGDVIGHVMISGATLVADTGERPIVLLAPIAVAPAHQEAGIGSALVRAVTAIADVRGEPLVVLEGSPGYYRRFGFEPSYERGIEMSLPDWAPREAGQVLRLSSYDASLTGLVVYPPTFDIVSE